MRPDENVELFALHLHVVLLLVQLILQPCVDLHQFITAEFLRLGLREDKDSQTVKPGDYITHNATQNSSCLFFSFSIFHERDSFFSPRSLIKLGVTHPDVGVNLLLKASDLGEVLPDGLLKVQDAAALLLGVTGNFQLETHTLLLLTVLLHVNKITNQNKQTPHEMEHRRGRGSLLQSGTGRLPFAWAPRVTTGC